ncbi:MAG: hypothetical protein PVH87_26800 [Desulfobacteraceae bacterium]|jgi:hypothetical protein
MNNNENYARVTAKDKNEYICPLELAQSKAYLDGEDLDECVEADVAGRYAGHLNIVWK